MKRTVLKIEVDDLSKRDKAMVVHITPKGPMEMRILQITLTKIQETLRDQVLKHIDSCDCEICTALKDGKSGELPLYELEQKFMVLMTNLSKEPKDERDRKAKDILTVLERIEKGG